MNKCNLDCVVFDVFSKILSYCERLERFILGKVSKILRERINNMYPDTYVNIYYEATNKNYLNILEWALNEKFYWNWNISDGEIPHAIKNGYLKMLHRISVGKNIDRNDLLHPKLCAIAASKGNLFMLKLMYDNNCVIDVEICEIAALEGHFQILEWTKQIGISWNKKVAANAARNGNLFVL